jgi:O-glycosyl hydrolase
MVKLLGKSLVAKGLFPATQISAADENSIATSVSKLTTYDDSAFSYISQINTHGYKGRSTANFAAIAALAATKKKILWMSESGPLSGTGGQDIAMFMAQEIIEDLKLMKVSGWIDWQSYAGGGDWETIRVDKNTLAVIPARRCYMQAAFGRFIRPGSQIIESNDPNTVAALVPRTGNLVCIVRNGTNASVNYTYDLTRFTRMGATAKVYQFLVSQPQTLSRLADITIANKQFSFTSPAYSVTTCVIAGVLDVVSTLSPSNNSHAPDFAVSTFGKHALAVQLARQGRFDLRVFDSAGKKILTVSKEGNQGNNLIDIGRSSIPAGVYFVDVLQENSHRQAMVRILK